MVSASSSSKSSSSSLLLRLRAAFDCALVASMPSDAESDPFRINRFCCFPRSVSRASLMALASCFPTYESRAMEIFLSSNRLSLAVSSVSNCSTMSSSMFISSISAGSIGAMSLMDFVVDEDPPRPLPSDFLRVNKRMSVGLATSPTNFAPNRWLLTAANPVWSTLRRIRTSSSLYKECLTGSFVVDVDVDVDAASSAPT
mmetsp:Transcript_21200/g.44583  ORF Transcript_21200/g.44583 Transcript_21200/m.44583 type:complete len:200 (+) Transcript_21200:168-767(+)